MTHCIYHAFTDYLDYLDLPRTRNQWWRYRFYKALYQGNADAMTYGGAAPGIIKSLVRYYRLDLKVEHTIWTPAHYRVGGNEMENFLQRCVVRPQDFGRYVDKITLKPAIYLCLTNFHAQFGLEIPVHNLPIMALQLYNRREK